MLCALSICICCYKILELKPHNIVIYHSVDINGMPQLVNSLKQYFCIIQIF